jgi:hypothetical protein
MGGTVVNHVVHTPEPIEWYAVDLTHTPVNVLWQAYYCSAPGNARDAIQRELSTRGEF